jgi:hypothetical protein
MKVAAIEIRCEHAEAVTDFMQELENQCIQTLEFGQLDSNPLVVRIAPHFWDHLDPELLVTLNLD